MSEHHPFWGIFDHDELERIAAGLGRRMSLACAARMCGVSPGTVAAWSGGRALSGEMAQRVAVAEVASANGWVSLFGCLRIPTGWRITTTTDSDGRVLVRVTKTISDERGGV